mgnify:CR=1 FL=1
MGDTITLEDGPYGSYVVRNEDGRSFLVQQDHDFPSIARTFGWSGRFSKRNYGKGHGAEITAARDWLDLNIGIDAEDPAIVTSSSAPDMIATVMPLRGPAVGQYSLTTERA